MKTASMKPEVALFDNEDLEDLDRNGSDWQFISLGEQQNFGIRTAGRIFGSLHLYMDGRTLISNPTF